MRSVDVGRAEAMKLGMRTSLETRARGRRSRLAVLALVAMLGLVGSAAVHAAEPAHKNQQRVGVSRGSPSKGRARSGVPPGRVSGATTVPLAGVQDVLVDGEASPPAPAATQLRPELRLALQAGL